MSAGNVLPLVVKIGGSTLGAHDTSLADVAALHAGGTPVVVVHGGGAAVSEWMERLQTPVEFVGGLRKTTETSLPVVVAVLAGLINTRLVQELAALGCPAVGLSGADAGMLRSPLNDRGLGLVGEAPVCDPPAIEALVDVGYLPVIAPLGLTPSADQVININADTAAGAIAAGLASSALIFLTDVPGILDAAGDVVGSLDDAEVEAMRASGVIGGGMLPKVEACLVAARAGAEARIVDGRQTGALRRALEGTEGTVIRSARC